MAVINSSKFDFSDVIGSELTRYGAQVQEEVYEIIPQVAKEAAKKLRSESPRSKGHHSGIYAKGWTATVEKGRTKFGAVVHGKKASTYAVAHLLEKPHANRDGSRYNPEHNKSGKSTVHIEPVEQWAINEAIDRVLRGLESRV